VEIKVNGKLYAGPIKPVARNIPRFLLLVKGWFNFSTFSFEGYKIIYSLFNYQHRNFIFSVGCFPFPFVI